MGDEDSGSDLIRVKAEPTGGIDVSVGKELPKLIANLLPTKFHVRRLVDRKITERVVEKIHADSALDEAEFAFLEEMRASDYALKYLRLKRIHEQAGSIWQENQPRLLGEGSAASSEEEKEQTSNDWINKFREDAALVDDELIAEIYARVLAEKAHDSKAFSLRTLAVLRYLDHEAAIAFGKLQPLVVAPSYVLAHSHGKDILEKCGVTYEMLLRLDDAGLINLTPSQFSTKSYNSNAILVLPGQQRLIWANRPNQEEFSIDIPVNILTPAGQQLTKIAQTEPDLQVFNHILRYLHRFLWKLTVRVATLPSRDWQGDVGDLNWETLDASEIEKFKVN
jgi:hypothetical protein